MPLRLWRRKGAYFVQCVEVRDSKLRSTALRTRNGGRLRACSVDYLATARTRRATGGRSPCCGRVAGRRAVFVAQHPCGLPRTAGRTLSRRTRGTGLAGVWSPKAGRSVSSRTAVRAHVRKDGNPLARAEPGWAPQVHPNSPTSLRRLTAAPWPRPSTPASDHIAHRTCGAPPSHCCSRRQPSHTSNDFLRCFPCLLLRSTGSNARPGIEDAPPAVRYAQ
jgi:hypothetical protein